MNVFVKECENAFIVCWEDEDLKVILSKQGLYETISYILLKPSKYSEFEFMSALLIVEILQERGKL